MRIAAVVYPTHCAGADRPAGSCRKSQFSRLFFKLFSSRLPPRESARTLNAPSDMRTRSVRSHVHISDGFLQRQILIAASAAQRHLNRNGKSVAMPLGSRSAISFASFAKMRRDCRMIKLHPFATVRVSVILFLLWSPVYAQARAVSSITAISGSIYAPWCAATMRNRREPLYVATVDQVGADRAIPD